MYAIEFEAKITSPFIELEQYHALLNQQVRVIILAQQEPATTTRQRCYDFSDLQGKLAWSGDALAQQRRVRDEW